MGEASKDPPAKRQCIDMTPDYPTYEPSDEAMHHPLFRNALADSLTGQPSAPWLVDEDCAGVQQQRFRAHAPPPTLDGAAEAAMFDENTANALGSVVFN